MGPTSPERGAQREDGNGAGSFFAGEPGTRTRGSLLALCTTSTPRGRPPPVKTGPSGFHRKRAGPVRAKPPGSRNLPPNTPASV